MDYGLNTTLPYSNESNGIGNDVNAMDLSIKIHTRFFDIL